MKFPLVITATILLLLCGSVQSQSNLSSLLLFPSTTFLTQLFVSEGSSRGMLIVDAQLYVFQCSQPTTKYPQNPENILAIEKFDTNTAYLDNEYWVVISTGVWTISQTSINLVSGNNGLIPQDFLATNTTIIYYLNQLYTQQMMQTSGATAAVVPGSPSTITNLYVVNGLGFISSPGKAYSFDPVLGAINLVTYCTTKCDSPSNFVTDGTWYYFTSNTGIWRTDGKTQQGTQLWCNATECQTSIAASSYGSMILFFSQNGTTLNLNLLNTNSMNTYTQLTTFTNQTLQHSSKSNFAVSTKFYFFVNPKASLNCSEIWGTDGTIAGTALETTVCVSNNTGAVSIGNIRQPSQLTSFYFQVSYTTSVNTTTEIWEFDQSTNSAGYVTTVCFGCSPSAEYLQVLTPQCLTYWGSDGLYLRYSQLVSNPSASSGLSSSWLVIFILIATYFYLS